MTLPHPTPDPNPRFPHCPRRHASVRVCERASVRACACARVRVCACAHVRMCVCARVRECATVLVRECAETRVRRCRCSSVYECTVCECAVQVFVRVCVRCEAASVHAIKPLSRVSPASPFRQQQLPLITWASKVGLALATDRERQEHRRPRIWGRYLWVACR